MHSQNGGGSGRCLISRADVARLPFKNGAFSAVICSEVLEHIPDSHSAVRELVRVLRPGGELVVSVPRYLPERICWALSEAYHNEPGGHIRIYRRKELQAMLEEAGLTCLEVRYKHGLHSPYWWLKCLVGHNNEQSWPVNLYKKFLEWDIIKGPLLIRTLERLLNPFIAKSIVFYLKKEAH
jgi:SAM-dependent methyltransferase